jgi:cytochrome c biogenesis factor
MVTSLSSFPSRHLALKPNLKNNRNLEIIQNTRSTENSRARSLTGPSEWSEMNIAHTGVVLFIIGILLSTTNKLEYTEQLHSGPSGVRLGAQICCLRSIDHSFAPTFHSICANLLVYQQSSIDWSQVVQDNVALRALRHGKQQGILEHSDLRLQMRSSALAESSRLCMFPEKRFYYSNQSAIATKVAIHSNLFTDFYSLIGTGSVETGWFTTIMKLPFIFCIWLGFFIGMLGGALRLRKQLQKSKLNWF